MNLAPNQKTVDNFSSGLESRRSTVLGERVKFFRSARRLTLRRLGELTGTTASFISQLERGLSGANTSTLMLIANALGISVADLFDESDASPHKVLKRTERPALPVSEGYRKMLLSRRPIRDVEVYCGEFEVGGSTGDAPYTHGDAHEMFLVLKGRLALTLGDECFVLEEGDSIEYATSTPHKTINVGATPAQVLWIIAPPTSGAVDLDQYAARKTLAAGLQKSDGGSSEES
ncbi:MAG: helix-turn-helix transcriptional regulator [Pseudaminobacter sp.]|nr:helix-turn-helix transcriptional regulator [Pseudaminobacter sp.]